MTIEGILLDLDNTVYDYKRAHQPAISAALDWLTLQLGATPMTVEAAYVEARKQTNERLHGQAASHSRLLYFQRVCEHFNHLPHRMACEATDIYWTVFFENMHLRPHLLTFLESIALPIAIVTDLTTRIQFDKIGHLEIGPFIKAIVTSEESGCEKPHPAIFQMAAAKLGLDISKLCVIGDSFERDIEGAIKLGITAYWLDTGNNGATPNVCAPNCHPDSVVIFNDFAALSQLIKAKA